MSRCPGHEDPEGRADWLDDHGFAHVSCGRCGWRGLTDTGQCDRCPTDCDKCGEERTDYNQVGDWCEDCATGCKACGEAVLRDDACDGFCPDCDGKAEKCDWCGGREDRGCEKDCTAGDEEASDD